MKIGIVSPYYIDRFGGVQSHILATRNELIRRGHDVVILAPKPRSSGSSKNSAHVVTLGSSAEVNFRSFQTTFPVAVSFNTKEIEDLLSREKFDVLHVHEPYTPMLPYQIVNRAQCPVIGTLHANWPDSIVYKSFGRTLRSYFRTAASKVDILTAVSDEAGKFARTGIDKKVVIVPNGIDLETYNRAMVPESKHVDPSKKSIVYIGRLEKRKGVIYLLKAYKELSKNHDNLELLIAGAGPTSRSLKDYTKRHKLSNVTFLGYVDEPTKLSLLKSADLYCSPALFGESFGIVLLESMAMSTVTVAGNNPGYKSLMQDRGRLSIVDPISTIDFAMRLELMLYDDDIRKLWQQWAKDYVKQFDYSTITDKYVDLYKKVANA